MEVTHTFAGSPLDRADQLVRDEAALTALMHSPEALFLPLWQLDTLVDSTIPPKLGFVGFSAVQWPLVEAPPVFLGLMSDVPCFALDLSCQADPMSALDIAEGWQFLNAFSAALSLKPPETAVLAHAKTRVWWHKNYGFCALCGGATEQVRSGHQRTCKNCGSSHFPRTDPVVIMLIEHEDKCLLGQSHGPLVQMGIWSALAGFVDQGESIEESVRREIMEESGIKVGQVKYHSSQPWPFPSSLMIGCHGQAQSVDIKVDKGEMHDVRWFPREQVLAASEGTEPGFNLPGPIAIAHHLIMDWATGKY